MQDPLLAIGRLAVRDVARRRPRPSDFDKVELGDDWTVRARHRRRLNDNGAPRWKRKRVDDTLPLNGRYGEPARVRAGYSLFFLPRYHYAGLSFPSSFPLWSAHARHHIVIIIVIPLLFREKLWKKKR